MALDTLTPEALAARATGLCYETDGWRHCSAGLCQPTRLREEDAPVTDPGLVLLGLALFDGIRADLAAQGIVIRAEDWLLTEEP
jgi:hypothetical protein